MLARAHAANDMYMLSGVCSYLRGIHLSERDVDGDARLARFWHTRAVPWPASVELLVLGSQGTTTGCMVFVA